MSTDLREVLAHLRNDLRGGMRRNHAPQRDDPSSSPSSSSHDEELHRRERRPLRLSMDNLKDMKIDCYRKYSSFKFIKPQVQGTSLCTWGVVRRELCSNYQNSLGRFKLGKIKRGKGTN